MNYGVCQEILTENLNMHSVVAFQKRIFASFHGVEEVPRLLGNSERVCGQIKIIYEISTGLMVAIFFFKELSITFDNDRVMTNIHH